MLKEAPADSVKKEREVWFLQCSAVTVRWLWVHVWMCACVHAYRHQWWGLCVCWAQLMPCYHLHWGIRTRHWQRINCRSDRWRSLFQWAGQGGGSAATLPEYQKEQGSSGGRGVGRCSWEIRTHLVELHIPLNVRGNYNELLWKKKQTLITSMNQRQVEIIVKFLTMPQLHFDISLPLKFRTLPKENLRWCWRWEKWCLNWRQREKDWRGSRARVFRCAGHPYSGRKLKGTIGTQKEKVARRQAGM